MTAHSEIWYVYGVVRSTFDVARSPDGVDDMSVELCAAGDLGALVSRLDAEEYAPATLERATEDVDWLAPRAVSHDRVLTWASDHGPVVPLPIFSLFSGAAAVQKMLNEQHGQLSAALERAASGREYALRVYRVDSELTKSAADLSPPLAELRDAAGLASPGQRYLLERKLDAERKNALHSIGAKVSREVFESLRPHALAATQSRIASRGAGAGDAALVLDAAFLVGREGFDAFQYELTNLVGRYSSRGFRFDFTGPWPAYHFVQERDDT